MILIFNKSKMSGQSNNSNLFQELTTPVNAENKIEEINQHRMVATEMAFSEITEGAVERMKRAKAQHPNTTYANLHVWTRQDPIKYNDGSKEHFLNDLLNKGDLISRLQKWFDQEHGQGKFMVYTHISRNRNIPNEKRRQSLSVSWDSEKFEQISENMRKHRENFSKLQRGPRKYNRNRRDRQPSNERSAPTSN